MKRKPLPAPGFPPELAEYDPELWVDRVQFTWARWDYWHAHPEIQRYVDPIELLRERRDARLEAQRQT